MIPAPGSKTRIFRFSETEKRALAATIAGLLAEIPEIKFAYLYGSFLDQVPCHDMDIGVYLEDLPPLDTEIFAIDLGAGLSRQAPCPVDVRSLNNASVPFRYQVLRGKLLVEKDPELHSRIVEQTIARYLDIKPLLLRATKEAFTGA